MLRGGVARSCFAFDTLWKVKIYGSVLRLGTLPPPDRPKRRPNRTPTFKQGYRKPVHDIVCIVLVIPASCTGSKFAMLVLRKSRSAAIFYSVFITCNPQHPSDRVPSPLYCMLSSALIKQRQRFIIFIRCRKPCAYEPTGFPPNSRNQMISSFCQHKGIGKDFLKVI